MSSTTIHNSLDVLDTLGWPYRDVEAWLHLLLGHTDVWDPVTPGRKSTSALPETRLYFSFKSESVVNKMSDNMAACGWCIRDYCEEASCGR